MKILTVHQFSSIAQAFLKHQAMYIFMHVYVFMNLFKFGQIYMNEKKKLALNQMYTTVIKCNHNQIYTICDDYNSFF